MLVPAGIIWPCPRSISLIGPRKCTGSGGNSRIASLKTWNTIELTLILYSWWERCACEMHLDFIYNDSMSLNALDIFGNEVSVWPSQSEFERVFQAWPMYPKERILSYMWGEARSVLQTVIGGNANGVIFKLLLTNYSYLKNGSVNQSMSIV